MTAVAALGVYRAYKHTMHDRVMTYLGLQRLDAEDLDATDVDEGTDVNPAASLSLTQDVPSIGMQPSRSGTDGGRPSCDALPTFDPVTSSP